MRAHLIVTLALLVSAPALADEPSGCDKFKWSIDRERTALTDPNRPKLASGVEMTAPAVTIGLLSPADAMLPKPPERTPKEGTFAGFVEFKTVPKAATYTISLSSAAWIDVMQDGRRLKPKGFSGAVDCDGIRKTMKYELTASPFVVQVSGATDRAISLAVLPSD